MCTSRVILRSAVVSFLSMSILVTGCSKPPFPTVTLHEAAERGELHQIRSHIYWESDVNERRRGDKDTPLHVAAEHGQVEAMKLLAAANGVDLDAENRGGRTPLDIAISNRQIDAIDVLLAKGASLERKNSEGRAPLEDALYHGNDEIAEFLLSRRVRLDVDFECQPYANVEYEGYTLLHRAAKRAYIGVGELLISRGADVNAEGRRVDGSARKDTKTPLSEAVDGKNLPMVEMLIDGGADLNWRYAWGGTLLHGAAKAKELSLARLLVSKRVDVNARDDDGKTALFYVAGHPGRVGEVSSWNLEFAELLLENGCDVNAQDNRGRTCLHYMHSGGPRMLFICLKAYKKEGDQDAYLSLLRLFRSHNANIHLRDKQGNEPLELVKSEHREWFRDAVRSVGY